MSQGSRRITVRVSEQLYADLLAELAHRERSAVVAPQDESEFIRLAIRHEIQHRRRGRRSRSGRPAQFWPDEIVSIVDDPDLYDGGQ